MITFKQLVERLFDIFEERVTGWDRKHVKNWLTSNGYEEVEQTGSHPKFKHTVTGHTIPGTNPHKKDVEPSALRNLSKLVRQHHEEHNFNYTPIDDRSIK